MVKKKTKILIFLIYFLGIFLLRKINTFSFNLSFFRNTAWELGLWLAGGILSGQFIKFDQLFFVYFIHPEQELSGQVKQLIKTHQFGAAWDLLDTKIGEQRLAFFSVIFQLVWLVAAIFTLTSTASQFGQAFVMGIGLFILIEEWESYLLTRNISWLFWQVKRQISEKEQKIYLYSATGVFTVLSLLLL